MTCFELKHRELEDIFRQDEHQLAENIEVSKREADEIKKEIREFLEKQRQGLQAIIDKRMRLQTPSPKFKLRKLPMWGEQVTDENINFEWPTQEMLDRMPAGVSLKSILLATSSQSGCGTICFTQCTLSNGDTSSLFSNNGTKEQHSQKV